MKNTISEMKNMLEGINSRLKGGDRISNLEDRGEENTQLQQQKEKGI